MSIPVDYSNGNVIYKFYFISLFSYILIVISISSSQLKMYQLFQICISDMSILIHIDYRDIIGEVRIYNVYNVNKQLF